jgi:hypothetical protein
LFHNGFSVPTKEVFLTGLSDVGNDIMKTMESYEKSGFHKNELSLPVDIGDRFIKFYQDRDFLIIKKLTTLEHGTNDLVNAQVEKLIETNKEKRKSFPVRYIELEKGFNDLISKLSTLRYIIESISNDVHNKYKIFDPEFIDGLHEEINVFQTKAYEHKNNAQGVAAENNFEDKKESTFNELAIDIASFKGFLSSIKERLKEKFEKSDLNDTYSELDQDLVENIKSRNFEKFWIFYEKTGKELEYLYQGLDELDAKIEKEKTNPKDKENERQVLNYYVFDRHKLNEKKINPKDLNMVSPIILELGVPIKISNRSVENIFKITNSLTEAATFIFPEYVKKVIVNDFNSVSN